MRLTHKDYMAILRFYSKDGSSMSKKQVKIIAEDILANKLCRCIKKVESKKKDKARSIAICTDSVLRKKNLKGHGFKCKTKPKLLKSVTKRNSKSSKRLSKIKKDKTRKVKIN